MIADTALIAVTTSTTATTGTAITDETRTAKGAIIKGSTGDTDIMTAIIATTKSIEGITGGITIIITIAAIIATITTTTGIAAAIILNG